LLLLAALSLGLAACGPAATPGPAGPASPTDVVTLTVEEITDPPATTQPPPSPGDGGGDGSGDGGGSGDDDGLVVATLPLPIFASPEDCVSYDPANLTVAASGDAWVLRDGGHSMKLFDTAADAEDALRVARRWTKLCFIGRANTGPDRYRYIINYFKDPSSLPLGLAPVTLECITYDAGNLALYEGPAHPADPTNHEWALHSGATPLLHFANQPDAERGRIVASGFGRLCFIGAGNDRPDPYRYQMEWWRP
jgi:hypothetical protein